VSVLFLACRQKGESLDAFLSFPAAKLDRGGKEREREQRVVDPSEDVG